MGLGMEVGVFLPKYKEGVIVRGVFGLKGGVWDFLFSRWEGWVICSPSEEVKEMYFTPLFFF